MEIKAKIKYLRIAPRKTRLVIDLIRGMEVSKALSQLTALNKKASLPIMKLLKSAVANAENTYELNSNNLYIKTIKVDEGPTLKRWMPRAQGRATAIRKRSSHINIILGEIKDSGKLEAKKQDIEAPVKLGQKPKEDDGVVIKKKDDGQKEKSTAKEDKTETASDPRSEGKGKHTKIEGKGSSKSLTGKIFRRKTG